MRNLILWKYLWSLIVHYVTLTLRRRSFGVMWLLRLFIYLSDGQPFPSQEGQASHTVLTADDFCLSVCGWLLSLTYQKSILAYNSEINSLKKIFVLETLKFLSKEFQFVMSLKIWRSMTYTVCQAPISVTSYICYRNYHIILILK